MLQQAVLRYHSQHYGDYDAEPADTNNDGMKDVVVADDAEVHIGIETAVHGVKLRVIGDRKVDWTAVRLDPEMIAAVRD